MNCSIKTEYKKKILFYSDITGYGGHEMMALIIMGELCRLGQDVTLICNADNSQLREAAEKIQGLSLCLLSLRPARGQLLTHLLPSRNQATVRRHIRQIDPDCIVAVQGTIGMSSLVLAAAYREQVPLLTYIAFAQKMRELGIPRALLRDLVNRLYYLLPGRFVVISDTQRELMQRNGVPAQRIAVIHNIVPAPTIRCRDKEEARRELGLEHGEIWIGLPGRVVIAHKGHDLLVRAVAALGDDCPELGFVIVGTGPDLELVKRLVRDSGVAGRFVFLPWSEEMGTVYAALDAVIMPSHHEGVPLVMIEAGLAGLPVIASAIDGIREFLPAEWLFPRGDLAQITERIRFIATTDQSGACAKIREKFSAIFQRSTIGEEFLAELAVLTKQSPCRRGGTAV